MTRPGSWQRSPPGGGWHRSRRGARQRSPPRGRWVRLRSCSPDPHLVPEACPDVRHADPVAPVAEAFTLLPLHGEGGQRRLEKAWDLVIGHVVHVELVEPGAVEVAAQ